MLGYKVTRGLQGYVTVGLQGYRKSPPYRGGGISVTHPTVTLAP